LGPLFLLQQLAKQKNLCYQRYQHFLHEWVKGQAVQGGRNQIVIMQQKVSMKQICTPAFFRLLELQQKNLLTLLNSG
jgi:hypothetical protein